VYHKRDQTVSQAVWLGLIGVAHVIGIIQANTYNCNSAPSFRPSPQGTASKGGHRADCGSAGVNWGMASEEWSYKFTE